MKVVALLDPEHLFGFGLLQHRIREDIRRSNSTPIPVAHSHHCPGELPGWQRIHAGLARDSGGLGASAVDQLLPVAN